MGYSFSPGITLFTDNYYMKYKHVSVLKNEVINYLDPKNNENCIDCTLGGGGHAKAILEKTAPNGNLLGIDLDINAIKAAKQNLKDYKNRIYLVEDNYKNLKQILKQKKYDSGFNKIDIILLDLGISSYEMQDKTRGFSFQGSADLDMRFGQTDLKASDIINNYSENELTRVFKEYGEERYSRLIAREIIKQRKIKPILKTDQLVGLIENVYKNKQKPKKIHVATKVFQGLRIETNDELNNLTKFLPEALEILNKGGRLGIISFHSLEDRIVKRFFKQESKDCLCPPQLPICQCNHQAQLKILTKKPVEAGVEEIKNNPRSRSAKLRAAEKI